MRDAALSRWQRWRVTPAARPADPAAGRFVRLPHLPAAEAPAADGIRHDLVDRVRRAIAAGTYDTEEVWAAAEERLLAAVGS